MTTNERDITDAIREARGERADDTVLWSQQRLPTLVRNIARLVLGLGSTVAVGLLVSLVVVGGEMRNSLLVALVAVTSIGGGFVGFVWWTDVGIDIHADGRLIRSGWGGIEHYDLGSYRRVSVKMRRSQQPEN